MKLEHTLDIGTDIASFFLFHPDDLVHRSKDPLDWHDYGFACSKEFEEGNLVAFRTGGDGGYQLRLTSGDLTNAEQAAQTGSWEWGYTVRHGKILVDNGDYLPSEEMFDIDDVPKDQWLTIPDGDYRVVVHPIERGEASLPDYVIRFESVEKPLHIAKSLSPPDLVPLKSRLPSAMTGGSADDIYKPNEDDKPLAGTYPLLVVEGQSLLPGGSTSLAVADDLFTAVQEEDKAITDEKGYVYVVLAPSEEIPRIATLAWINGSSQMTGESGKISMRGERLVRITGRTEGILLPIAQVEPVTRKKSEVSEAEIKALQAAFVKYAGKHAQDKSRIRAFDQERIAATTKGAALTARLLELVPLPVETRLRLQGASDVERAKELITLLESA